MPGPIKILHIQKTPPDDLQRNLMRSLSQDRDSRCVSLFDPDDVDVDYGELIDLIFESDKVITWW
jgi:hypothetical protein